MVIIAGSGACGDGRCDLLMAATKSMQMKAFVMKRLEHLFRLFLAWLCWLFFPQPKEVL